MLRACHSIQEVRPAPNGESSVISPAFSRAFSLLGLTFSHFCRLFGRGIFLACCLSEPRKSCLQTIDVSEPSHDGPEPSHPARNPPSKSSMPLSSRRLSASPAVDWSAQAMGQMVCCLPHPVPILGRRAGRPTRSPGNAAKLTGSLQKTRIGAPSNGASGERRGVYKDAPSNEADKSTRRTPLRQPDDKTIWLAAVYARPQRGRLMAVRVLYLQFVREAPDEPTLLANNDRRLVTSVSAGDSRRRIGFAWRPHHRCKFQVKRPA
jgi:hypothetical protein